MEKLLAERDLLAEKGRRVTRIEDTPSRLPGDARYFPG